MGKSSNVMNKKEAGDGRLSELIMDEEDSLLEEHFQLEEESKRKEQEDLF